jgi:endonuclease YncB( thermonuclease family)
MTEHDFKTYPELTNKQIEEFGFDSPHEQITEDFRAICVKVHDGDTITLRTDFRDFDFPLRFSNIDAPELNEGSRGTDAKEWLENQILDQEIEIEVNRENRVDKYGRLLGTVISLGMDMGQAEVSLGIAVPFGKKREGEPVDINKTLSTKKWF